MLREFSLSGLVGMIAAMLAWIATIMIVGQDDRFFVQGREIEWGTIIGVLTAVAVIGVLIAMHRSVEPILTTLAGAAGCALLYNTRELPLIVRGDEFSRVDDSYWPVVASMIVIFILLVLSLRITQNNTRGR